MGCKIIDEVIFQLDFELQTVILKIFYISGCCLVHACFMKHFFVIDFKQIIKKRIWREWLCLQPRLYMYVFVCFYITVDAYVCLYKYASDVVDQ